jgi:hypothetical protein
MVRHFKSDAARMRWSYLSSGFVALVQWIVGHTIAQRPVAAVPPARRNGVLRPATQSSWGTL